jgi:hypothetical protein
MYNLINTNIQLVLRKIRSEWISEYDWLIANLQYCHTAQYQHRFKVFWRLNAARLNNNFCNAYFQALQNARTNPPDLSNLAVQLYATPTHGNGRKSLQFSFASKLVHMVSPSVPIYDSLVAAFYFYVEPNRKLPLQQRVALLVAFHNFLTCEYQRILAQNLLAPSIAAFRSHFTPRHFTDEKVIDSLIWGYVSLLKGGAAVQKQITYV